MYIGNNPLKVHPKQIGGSLIKIDGEGFYKISNYDQMRPFFMSIVSSTDLWMFISSTGGLSAGRKNPDQALFPYDTDDKISDNSEITGSKTILIIEKEGRSYLWEPFSDRYFGIYAIERNLYKSVNGDTILFEEINEDLKIRFQYRWSHAEKFGFIKHSIINNDGDLPVSVNVLDGIQNILPPGISKKFQSEKSNLVNAYKKSELIPEIGLGVYSLSSNIVDRPEPSESLKSTTVWSTGLQNCNFLISSIQLHHFRQGLGIKQETDVRAERGAYFLNKVIKLNKGGHQEWFLVAEVNQDAGKMAEIELLLKGKENISEILKENIQNSSQNLQKIVRESDGIQLTADQLSCTRHISNVTFNVMRGGIFDNGYQIERDDLLTYIKCYNKPVAKKFDIFLNALPQKVSHDDLIAETIKLGDQDLLRLCFEYLPLYFSRRHGDPSRPWNTFSIETKTSSGDRILNYEGNWRDIFQNWEALSVSYPNFVESMITKFLNASTADGYNPYRITRNGIEWEMTDPDDPWSFIGYWGDHQIIYLLKLLELSDKYHPGILVSFLNQSFYSFANVPYRIKSHEEILKNPYDTIIFDFELNAQIQNRVTEIGSDGKLVWTNNGSIKKVNLLEKLLIPLLAKFSNFIPEGGIWLNTQRPEWNDANNALVGYGVSMVTLYYIRRYIVFLNNLIGLYDQKALTISIELKAWFEEISEIFQQDQLTPDRPMDGRVRSKIVDQLGAAKDNYNTKIYTGFTEKNGAIGVAAVQTFFNRSLQVIDHTIKINKRNDQLYHSYNLLSIGDSHSCDLNHLYEMLEGQVAVLSSGSLSAIDAVELLDAMKQSKLFRKDQYSYILYPNRELAKFHKKNTIPKDLAIKSLLIGNLIENQNESLIYKDVKGEYHFNKEIKNAKDIDIILSQLSKAGNHALVDMEGVLIKEIFESMFSHKSFTGRSGTFYGYEGLNSIYWHMVSKLLLAVQENIYRAYDKSADKKIIDRLIEHYYQIRAGIGYSKSPELYGAFPTDPYSHTPGNKGVQQPGMTGQVKEDILSRFGELGVRVNNGKIQFSSVLLRKSEFIASKTMITEMGFPQILAKDFIAFSFCNIPFLYRVRTEKEKIIIHYHGNKLVEIEGLILEKDISKEIFNRDPKIKMVEVYLSPNLD